MKEISKLPSRDLKLKPKLGRRNPVVRGYKDEVPRDRRQRGEEKPETFTFLGFTHYCGKRRSDSSFIVWRRTAKKRMVAKLRALQAELTFRRHEPVAQSR
jgi:hypothetical protein